MLMSVFCHAPPVRGKIVLPQGRPRDPEMDLAMALTPSLKKLIGTIAILVWMIVYSLLAMRLGIAILPQSGGLIRFLYYAVAGTLWIVPIGLALPWMHREPPRKPHAQGTKRPL